MAVLFRIWTELLVSPNTMGFSAGGGTYGKPSSIHTPYGEWKFTGGSGRGDWTSVKERLQKDLGLVLLQPGIEYKYGYSGPTWKITQWNGESIPDAVYKKEIDYYSLDHVRKVFDEFRETHQVKF